MKTIGLISILLLLSTPVTAQTLSPADEARATALSRDIRCVICQGQSIEDSNAPLAADMRAALRTHIAQGASDQEILDALRHSYGETILFKPVFAKHTLFLWLAPALVLAGGILSAAFYAWQHNRRQKI